MPARGDPPASPRTFQAMTSRRHRHCCACAQVIVSNGHPRRWRRPYRCRTKATRLNRP